MCRVKNHTQFQQSRWRFVFSSMAYFLELGLNTPVIGTARVTQCWVSGPQVVLLKSLQLKAEILSTCFCLSCSSLPPPTPREYIIHTVTFPTQLLQKSSAILCDLTHPPWPWLTDPRVTSDQGPFQGCLNLGPSTLRHLLSGDSSRPCQRPAHVSSPFSLFRLHMTHLL